MFCVECGKETAIFKEGVCLNCYLKSHVFTNGPNELDLPICQYCNSLKYKNTWSSDLLDDLLQKWIKNNFNISKELKKVKITTECKETKQGIKCKVIISGFIDKEEITEKHCLLIHLKKNVCDVCSKKFGGYHEAIIQVRAGKRKLVSNEIDEMINKIQNLVENLHEKGNRSLFITDIGEEHGNLDFFISDKSAAFTIAKEIQKQYGGSIKQSSKNIGMKDGKQLYRMTYLVRIISYKRGDFVKFNNDFFQIDKISGNKIKLTDLRTWQQKTEDTQNLENAKIIGDQKLIKEMILVSQTEKETQLMNPETYEIRSVIKPEKINLKSDRLKIINIEDQIFILPNNT